MEQEVALGIMLDGRSVFLTGAAGSGKTYVLNQFIRRAKGRGWKVARTATTGLAATHLDGCTIHSWSGVGVLDSFPRGFFENFAKTRKKKIQETDVLIIDEISMMHDYLLDMVDQVCRVVRESDRPFGGMQVVLAGDFAQLPPVTRGEDGVGNYAYNAKVWAELAPVVCYLKTQHRQEDATFVEILNAIREGRVRRGHAEALLERVGAELPGNAAELYTTNFNVDQVNHRRLAGIEAEEEVYEMTSTGSEGKVESLKRGVLAPEVLRLKVGATVMAVKNDQAGRWVNGSLGEVMGFDPETGYPEVRLNTGRTVTVGYDTWEMRDGERKVAGVTQIPLRLAWAITVHKSQGMTLDAARLDLRRTFAPGMGYVALSRVKSLEALSLVGIGRTALVVAPEAVEMNRRWMGEGEEYAREFRGLWTELEEGKGRGGSARAGSVRAGRGGGVRGDSGLGGGTGSGRGGAGELSAEEAEKLAEQIKKEKTPWQQRVEKMREIYPKAFMPWEYEDDELLQELLVGGASVGEMVEETGRQPNAVRLRIQANYGEEVEL